MMKDAALTAEPNLHPVVLDDEHKFRAAILVRHLKNFEYYLRLQFPPLSFDEFRQVLQLSRSNRKFMIASPAISDYRISHIKVTNYIAKSDFTMLWECLSFSSDTFYDLRTSYYYR